jgi:murein endopeptidase
VIRSRQPIRLRSHALAVIVGVFILGNHARADAPTTTPPLTQHQVLVGERLAEIAERYGVATEDIVRWNDLDAARPMIRQGHSLKIYAFDPPPPRTKLSYRIRPGDTWIRIARARSVDSTHLRTRWNPKMGNVLRAGEHLTIWVESSTGHAADANAAVDASGRSQSIGKPTRGRILGLSQLPPRPELYTVRTPNHSYGSTHAIELIQIGIAAFRASSGFTGEINMGDLSQKHGGRFRPHHSHQSGRDVDIRLPLRAGLPTTTIPERADQVDWDVTWKLVRAMLDTGQVVFVFLTSNRQKYLYDAAVRAGTSVEVLNDLIQYPRHARTAVIRHSRGHTKHVHVRFTCASYETRCRD